jgi:hypothetical protein
VYYLDFFFIHPVYFPPLVAKPCASGVPKPASGAPSPTKVNKTRLEKKKKKMNKRRARQSEPVYNF